jgi:hypothetical protein
MRKTVAARRRPRLPGSRPGYYLFRRKVQRSDTAHFRHPARDGGLGLIRQKWRGALRQDPSHGNATMGGFHRRDAGLRRRSAKMSRSVPRPSGPCARQSPLTRRHSTHETCARNAIPGSKLLYQLGIFGCSGNVAVTHYCATLPSPYLSPPCKRPAPYNADNALEALLGFPSQAPLPVTSAGVRRLAQSGPVLFRRPFRQSRWFLSWGHDHAV